MKLEKMHQLLAGLEPWKENFGQGMEYRGKDGLSWYDLSINANSLPCQTRVAIIVTAWMGQLKWLKATLASYRRTGAFVVLAYDNPFYAWMERSPNQVARCLPNQEHYLLAHSVVMKHITYDADKRNGWFWDVRYAQGILKQFPQLEYVYVTNGDCLLEKPEGLPEVISLLGEHDLMAGQQTPNGTIHTADMLFRAPAFHRTFDHMAELMRVPVLGARSPEGMLKETVQYLGLQVKAAPEQPLDKDGTVDCYARYGQCSTWNSLLGFRNLFAEQETAWNDGLEPLPAKFVDPYLDWLYFAGDERETICRYYETGDRRFLMKWWDCGEDSDYNRLYYPVEFYGKEPIYERPAGEKVTA